MTIWDASIADSNSIHYAKILSPEHIIFKIVYFYLEDRMTQIMRKKSLTCLVYFPDIHDTQSWASL